MSTATTQRRSRRASPAPQPKTRSSLLPLTIAALVLAVVVVGVLLISSGLLNQGSSRDLAQPNVARPAHLIAVPAVGAAPAPVTLELC